MKQIMHLCYSCAERMAEGFNVKKTSASSVDEKCEFCKKRSYLNTYEVSSKKGGEQDE